MRLNADFSQRVVIRPDEHEWRASPMPGVERMMLDRIGDEVARATSIVRYAPDSRFSSHVHGGGEELLVLSGAFHDQSGAYPAGAYVRNPIGTKHAPWAGPEGTEIFVKLHQFDANDTRQFHVDTTSSGWEEGAVPGLYTLPLHSFEGEDVCLERWPSGFEPGPQMFPKGAEILILHGGLNDPLGAYPSRSWLRLPSGEEAAFRSAAAGVLFYKKTGHLSPEKLSKFNENG